MGRGSWISWDPEWLPADDADRWFRRLDAGSSWSQEPIHVFGKDVLQPREMDWAGELPYRYSGLTLDPRPLTDDLAALTAMVEAATGERFNHVVLNRYRDGRDHIRYHRDAERELGNEPVIASLSLGASRLFEMQGTDKRRRTRRLTMVHGGLLVMGGTFQRHWRHGVPKVADDVGPRINVTWRWLHGPPGWRPEG